MTKELSEIALAFARECLGWEKVTISGGHTNGYLGGNLRWFNHTDLNAVLEAVRAWVDSMPAWYVQITSDEDDGWIVLVFGPDDDGIARGEDLCRCLMKACIDAHRKVEGIKE